MVDRTTASTTSRCRDSRAPISENYSHLLTQVKDFLYTANVRPVIALVDDLMFLSRIREAARGAALDVKTTRKTQDVLEAARAGACLLLLDLDSPRLPWAEAVASIRADPALATLPVVGFLSHVNADAAREAHAVGCTQILARSAFVQQLPRMLAAAAHADAPMETP